MIPFKRLTMTSTKAVYRYADIFGDGIIEFDIASKESKCTDFKPRLDKMKDLDFSKDIEKVLYVAKGIIEAGYPDRWIYATH